MPISESPIMLEIRNLKVSYGPVTAVRGIDFSIGSHETVALLGANGAGKTSTLRAISQLIRYSGSIIFEGDDLRGCAPDRVARLGIVHVPEGRHVFADLSVHENLRIGMSGRGGRQPTFAIDDVYDLFPALVRLRNRLGYALSGGEQQMV